MFAANRMSEPPSAYEGGILFDSRPHCCEDAFSEAGLPVGSVSDCRNLQLSTGATVTLSQGGTFVSLGAGVPGTGVPGTGGTGTSGTGTSGTGSSGPGKGGGTNCPPGSIAVLGVCSQPGTGGGGLGASGATGSRPSGHRAKVPGNSCWSCVNDGGYCKKECDESLTKHVYGVKVDFGDQCEPINFGDECHRCWEAKCKPQ